MKIIIFFVIEAKDIFCSSFIMSGNYNWLYNLIIMMNYSFIATIIMMNYSFIATIIILIITVGSKGIYFTVIVTAPEIMKMERLFVHFYRSKINYS